jgi:anthranilate synthase component 1
LTELVREIAGPSDLRQLHREYPSRYPFLLQSTGRGGALNRYDILFAFPGEALVAGSGTNFLDELDTRWQRERTEIEPGLRLKPDTILPAAFAVRCPVGLVFDHHVSRCFLVCETPGCVNREQLQADIDSLQRDCSAAQAKVISVQEEEPTLFADAVVRAKNYIAEGDVYQANLSREWAALMDGSPDASDIYEVLCKSNPGPFAGMARWRDIEIISSSPERLLEVRDGVASTRPIAGTRPRSDDVAVDDNLSAELFAHPKERAEHIMLVRVDGARELRACAPHCLERAGSITW